MSTRQCRGREDAASRKQHRLRSRQFMALAAVWLDAPRLGHHWLLVGLLCAAVLIALACVIRGAGSPLRRAGSCFLFYAFAAFAKLNSGFVDHQHFYDFTAVLFALFGLFLPDTDTAELHRHVDGSPCSPLAQLQAC